MTRIEDLKTVLGQTQDHRHRVLVAAAKNVRMWFTKVRKIKSIYHTLNLFNLDVTQKCLIAECWCPSADLDKIQLALKRGTVSCISIYSVFLLVCRKKAAVRYHRFSIVWIVTKCHRPIIDWISIRVAFKILSTHMVLLHIVKLIRVCFCVTSIIHFTNLIHFQHHIRSLRFHFYSLLCLAIVDTDWLCWLRHYILYYAKNN